MTSGSKGIAKNLERTRQLDDRDRESSCVICTVDIVYLVGLAHYFYTN